jgi:hypothetical protein
MSAEAACSHAIVVFALNEGFHLGVLSSSIHVIWALASSGRLGVGNDPRYQKSLAFDPFPFPDASPESRTRIADVAEEIDRLRKVALESDERVTLTGIYNVLDRLRSGESLTDAERTIHDLAACGVLRDLHDELDRQVAEAYGWPWPLASDDILGRLVGLHDDRVIEESRGLVRWLRPGYQAHRFGSPSAGDDLGLRDETASVQAPTGARLRWPSGTVDQIGIVKAAIQETPGTADELRSRFDGAARALIERHLETLEIVGEAIRGSDGKYRPVPSREAAV